MGLFIVAALSFSFGPTLTSVARLQLLILPSLYADFESILEPMDPVEPVSPSEPYTNEVNQHSPSGCCVYSNFAYGDVDNPLRTYRGKDCIETFCNYIKGEARRLYHMFPELPMGPLTKKQWKKYKRSTINQVSHLLQTIYT